MNSSSSSNKKKKIKNLGGYIHVDRKELGDIDYIDQLSAEEEAWLNKFTDEVYNGRFKNDGTDIISSKAEKRKIWREKAKRQNDFTNKLFPVSTSEPGMTVLKPLDAAKKKNKK